MRGGGGGGGGTTTQESAPLAASFAPTLQRARTAVCVGYEHVYLTVQRVRLRALDGTWSEIVLPLLRQIDLLDLTTVGVLESLGLPAMPLGQYSEVRLVLASDTGSTTLHAVQPTGGALTPLSVKAARGGLKLDGPLAGAAGEELDLVLLNGFDPCQAILETGDAYQLKSSLSVKVRNAEQTATPVTPGGVVGSSNPGAGFASSMSSTITIQQEPTVPSTYFWAQQFYLTASIDHNGYFGLQTGGSTNGQLMGKMVIFSMWNAINAEAGPTAIAVPFGGEGIGYSVRASFDWQENVPYTFALSKVDASWWQIIVTSPGAEPLYLGRIQITQDASLQMTGNSFTEYFTELAGGCQALPYARTAFSILSFDGTLVPAFSANPYGPCEAYAKGTVIEGVAIHEAGVAANTVR